MMRDGNAPVEAVDAAALVLVRSGAAGPELLMAQRRPDAGFAPVAWVFPGGIVEDQDRAAPAIPGLDEPSANAALGVATGARAFWWAAAREALEEVRLMPGLDADTAQELFDSIDASSSFSGRLCQAGIEGALAGMAYCGYLVTPPAMRRRYATRFFMARADGNPVVDGEEIVDARWIAPDDALARHAAGDFPIIFPQLMQLKRYVEFTSAESLLGWAQAGAERPTERGEQFV